MNFEKSLKMIMKSALDVAKPEGRFRNLPKKPKGKLIVLGAGKLVQVWHMNSKILMMVL